MNFDLYLLILMFVFLSIAFIDSLVQIYSGEACNYILLFK